jgi:hypothetical protein
VNGRLKHVDPPTVQIQRQPAIHNSVKALTRLGAALGAVSTRDVGQPYGVRGEKSRILGQTGLSTVRKR